MMTPLRRRGPTLAFIQRSPELGEAQRGVGDGWSSEFSRAGRWPLGARRRSCSARADVGASALAAPARAVRAGAVGAEPEPDQVATHRALRAAQLAGELVEAQP